jgi:hypothetical protein
MSKIKTRDRPCGHEVSETDKTTRSSQGCADLRSVMGHTWQAEIHVEGLGSVDLSSPQVKVEGSG